MVTISMMVLLALLAVGLLSLSTVSLRSSGQLRAKKEAQANARLALELALNELQKALGPDQRVSSFADLATGTVNDSEDAGRALASGDSPKNTSSLPSPDGSRGEVVNGLVAVSGGSRFWTGAWGNYGGYGAAESDDIFKQSPAPVLLNWLVSGNETAEAYDVEGSDGSISSSSIEPPFTPASPISGLKADTGGRSDGLTVGGRAGVVLVGKESVAAGSPDADDLERYVVAPLVDVVDGDGEVTGRYAFWVGDEGVKSRINVVDQHSDSNDAANDVMARARLMVPPRTGAEVLPDFSGSDYLALSQGSGESTPVGKAVTYQQAELMDPVGITKRELGESFHSLSTYSESLLTDTYRGGLKRDLTTEFSGSQLGSWETPEGMSGGQGAGIIPEDYSPKSVEKSSSQAYLAGTWEIPRADRITGPLTGASGASSSYGFESVGTSAPRWDILYDYHNFYPQNQSSGTIAPQGAGMDQMGVSPLILQTRILFGVDAPASSTMKALFTPLVVLGNPYSVPMDMSGLTLKFLMTTSPWMTDKPSETWRTRISYAAGETAASRSNERFMTLLPLENTASPSQYNVGGPSINQRRELNRDLEFVLPDGVLQPGESKIFSLLNRIELGSGSGASVKLSEGTAADFASDYNYVARASTTNSPDFGSDPYYYKVQESGNSVPMVVLMQDRNGKVLQRLGGLNLEAITNQFGIYREMRGATAPAGASKPRIFAGYTFYQAGPGTTLGSALRPYADLNLRASNLRMAKGIEHSKRDNYSLLAPVGAFLRDTTYAGSIAVANPVRGNTLPPPEFTEDLDPVEWGFPGVESEPVLYDLPQEPLLSIGGLQHANVTADDGTFNTGVQPAHAIGNSYAPVYLPRESSIAVAPDTQYYSEAASVETIPTNYYDMSYLINSALWDGYFFSSLGQSSSGDAPLNPRYRLVSDDSVDGDSGKVAASLRVEGGFNVNSTSAEAWASLLAGMRALPALPVGGASANRDLSIFPRGLRQPSGTSASPSGRGDDSYSGIRGLTDEQVVDLGERIARQVRLRGPFVSLAQFVNRVLVDADEDDAGLGFSGAIQSAIDGTTINDFSELSRSDDELNTRVVSGGSESDFFSYFYSAETAQKFSKNAPRKAQRSTGIPGWLTQADVLQAIGPVLSVRSDTFVIRSYGEALGTDGETVLASARCEVVVQRRTDYIDPADQAWVHPRDVGDVNRRYGRRFEIISFRWLHSDEV